MIGAWEFKEEEMEEDLYEDISRREEEEESRTWARQVQGKVEIQALPILIQSYYYCRHQINGDNPHVPLALPTSLIHIHSIRCQ